MGKSKERKGTSMDKSPEVITTFEILSYGKVIIETSDKVRYYSDLSSLSQTYCYPKNQVQWRKASIDSHGLALVWESRFEAHKDQMIGLAFKTESVTHPKKRTG